MLPHSPMGEHSRRLALWAIFYAFLLTLASCGRAHTEKPVLTFSGHLYWQTPVWHEAIYAFTRDTGIPVKVIAYSDEAEDRRRAQYQEWLHAHAPIPDIYQTDVTFLSTIAADVLDLKPYAEEDARAQLPAVLDQCSLHGRLVALPLYTDVELLYYRSDLLHKYGFAAPPKTWKELESMATVIQRGERAAGEKDFWGYVWEGNPSNEGLTASAFEWQASEGGGHIVEPNGCVNVNNAPAIAALKRARSWIGRISPPGTTAYAAGDVTNVWVGGHVAFMRNWPEFLRHSVQGGVFSVTQLPAGSHGAVGTLGGWNLSVSKYSAHPAEAVRLVRYLTGGKWQLSHAIQWGVTPSRIDTLQSPELLSRYPDFANVHQALAQTATARPSAVLGPAYPAVSVAYSRAVLSVLNDQDSAADAMTKLSGELVSLTGMPACQAGKD